MYKLYFMVEPSTRHGSVRHEVYRTEIPDSSAAYIAEESGVIVKMSDRAAVRVWHDGTIEVCVMRANAAGANAAVGFDGHITIATGDAPTVADLAVDAFRLWDYVKQAI